MVPTRIDGSVLSVENVWVKTLVSHCDHELGERGLTGALVTHQVMWMSVLYALHESLQGYCSRFGQNE